jgi:uncharacterized membrane protein YoaK (UPF0700 family)
VSAFFTDVRRAIVPDPGAPDGPLPPLLVGLTVVTGLVDAFSYLVLGHVFVANMTGNVVFLGFALVGASGFSLAASLVALGSFWFGALAGGALGVRLGHDRSRLLAGAVSLEACCLLVSVALAQISGRPVDAAYRYPLIVVLAAALGLQNATARRLAVPDLTTTVLTLTITGSAADSAVVGGKGASAGRRFTSVSAMFAGALAGAACIVHNQATVPLAIAFGFLALVAFTAQRSGRGEPAWVRPRA